VRGLGLVSRDHACTPLLNALPVAVIFFFSNTVAVIFTLAPSVRGRQDHCTVWGWTDKTEQQQPARVNAMPSKKVFLKKTKVSANKSFCATSTLDLDDAQDRWHISLEAKLALVDCLRRGSRGYHP